MPVYYNGPCNIKTKTEILDINASDFRIAPKIMVNRPTDVDLDLSLLPVQNFGDVRELISALSADLYDDENAVTPVVNVAGPITSGAPSKLDISLMGLSITSSNVGNIWKVVYQNVVVVAADGQTITLPSFTILFPSPL